MSAAAKAWEELARDISGVSAIVRTGQEIQKKWICVKSVAKAVAVEQKKDVKVTGGGVSSGVETSDSQQRILGSSARWLSRVWLEASTLR